KLRDRHRLMTSEPCGLLATLGYAAGEVYFECALAENQRFQPVGSVIEVFFDQSIGPVDLPVQLLLLEDHAGPEVLPITATGLYGLEDRLRTRRRAGNDSRWAHLRESLRQCVQTSTRWSRQRRWERELLELRPGELPEPFPHFRTGLLVDATDALEVADLLEPEAGRGRVEDAEELQVLGLCRRLRQLDHRRGLLEHLPAPVQHEVVVRRHEGEGDGKGRPMSLREEHRVDKPTLSAFLWGLTEVESRRQVRTVAPEPSFQLRG